MNKADLINEVASVVSNKTEAQATDARAGTHSGSLPALGSLRTHPLLRRSYEWAMHQCLSQEVCRMWMKALRRRSQKHNLKWDRMKRPAAKWLPPARVCHPYPLVRFGVIT